MIAVINARSALLLKENARFLERAGADGRVRPRDWRAGSSKYRSLTVREDGSCELQGCSTATATRRLGGVTVRGTGRKTKVGERG